MKLHGLHQDRAQGRTVVLGTFDGVHLGHQQLIRRAVELGAGEASAFTFNIPPEQFFNQHLALICSFPERRHRMEEFGLEEIIWTQFNHEVAQIQPDTFVSQILVNRLQVERVVCGYNFRFGLNAVGDVEMLRQLGLRFGFAVDVLPPFLVHDRPVSSTRVRQAIIEGHIDWANQLLGRPHNYTGTVIPGKQKGRQLGSPTANLAIDPDVLLPGDGVYLSLTEVGGKTLPAVTAVSPGPTFNGTQRTFETHIVDFSCDLYGQTLTVQLLHRLRSIQRYESIDALQQQIQNDIQCAKKLIYKQKKLC